MKTAAACFLLAVSALWIGLRNVLPTVQAQRPDDPVISPASNGLLASITGLQGNCPDEKELVCIDGTHDCIPAVPASEGSTTCRTKAGTGVCAGGTECDPQGVPCYRAEPPAPTALCVGPAPPGSRCNRNETYCVQITRSTCKTFGAPPPYPPCNCQCQHNYPVSTATYGFRCICAD